MSSETPKNLKRINKQKLICRYQILFKSFTKIYPVLVILQLIQFFQIPKIHRNKSIPQTLNKIMIKYFKQINK